MSKLKPLPSEKLTAFTPMFSIIENIMGFVPNSTKTMARNPALLEAFSKLGLHVMTQGTIPSGLKHLVAHASSNASGCRYCQAHTIGNAAKNGATEEQLNAVWDFENSSVFSEKEKAALRFGFASGSSPNGVTDEHFTDLRKHFSELEILELGGIISLFGFLNRWNDTFGTPLENKAIEHGEKYLTKSGWGIGKHT